MGSESGDKPAKRIGLFIAIGLVAAILLVFAYINTVARSHANDEAPRAQAK